MLGFCAARISYDESRTWRNDPAISDITINQHLVARFETRLGFPTGRYAPSSPRANPREGGTQMIHSGAGWQQSERAVSGFHT